MPHDPLTVRSFLADKKPVKRAILVDPAVVDAFLATCQARGIDPTAQLERLMSWFMHVWEDRPPEERVKRPGRPRKNTHDVITRLQQEETP